MIKEHFTITLWAKGWVGMSSDKPASTLTFSSAIICKQGSQHRFNKFSNELKTESDNSVFFSSVIYGYCENYNILGIKKWEE